jgi:hypothetical protein
MLRIRYILVRIRIRGSVPLTNGSKSDSGSGYCYFLSVTFKMATKNYFLKVFLAYYLLKLHLRHFPKIKSHKEATKQ